MAKQIFKVDIDLEQNQLLQAVIENALTAPGSPEAGQIYYDTTLDKMGLYVSDDGTNNPGWLYFTMDGGAGYLTQIVGINTPAITVTYSGSTAEITIALATTTVDGLMSAADKLKLDSATDADTPSTLVERDASGIINVSQITISGTPTNSTDAATKGYVDGLVQGLKTKLPAKAIAETNISLSGLDPIDGYTPVDGDRILVIGQSGSSVDNGIYIAQSGSWTRADDLKIGDSAANTYLFIEEGTVNADTGWVCTTNSPNDVVGDDDLAFVKFSSAGVIEAGQGLTKAGNVINIINNDGSIDVGTNDIAVKRDPNGGIGVFSTGIGVTPKTDGGITVDGDGVSVVGDNARAVTVGPNGVGVNVEGTDVVINGSNEIALGDRVTKTVYSNVSLVGGTASTITHGLGTQNVNVTVIDQTSGEQYFMNITQPTNNTVVVTSNSNEDVTVIISGAVGAVV